MKNDTLIIFLGASKKQELFWKTYHQFEAGRPHDIVISYIDKSIIPPINNKNGTIVYENKIVDGKDIPHKAFGAYRHFFNKYKNDYKYFAFVSDDVIIRNHNWLKKSIDPLDLHEKLGWTATQIYSEPATKRSFPDHLRAPIWFAKSEALAKIKWEFNHDHEGEINTADQFLDAGYFGIQVGNKFDLAYDSLENGGNGIGDSMIACFEAKFFPQKNLILPYTDAEITSFQNTIWHDILNNDVEKWDSTSPHPTIGTQNFVTNLQGLDGQVYVPSLPLARKCLPIYENPLRNVQVLESFVPDFVKQAKPVTGKKYLIALLQHRDVNFAITSFLHIHAALHDKKELRDLCHIVFATSAHNSKELAKIKELYGNDYSIEILDCNPHYPKKMKDLFAKYPTRLYPNFIKHDEDIFISSESWKKLLDLSEQELKEEKTLLATVELSTGIPTWEYFSHTVLSHEMTDKIREHLLHDRIPDSLWGNDYSSVNAVIASMKSWDENAYWNAVNKLPYFYKGIHPVRTNVWYTKVINNFLIKNYGAFQNTAPENKFIGISNRYFCNSFFVINFELYQKLMAHTSLFVDDYDEVPINKFRENNGMSFKVLAHSAGIHIMYNTIPKSQAIERSYLIQYRGKVLELLRKFDEERTNHVPFFKQSLKKTINNIPLVIKLKDILRPTPFYYLKRIYSSKLNGR